MGLVNIENTNFENGVSNRNARDIFGSMAQLDPTRFHNYMEDFDYYVAGNFTIAEVGVGTQALADIDGGVLRATTAGADDDNAFFLKNGEGFVLAASLPTYFRARLQTDDATESDLLVGLVDTSGLTPNNGVIFRKDDDAETLSVIIRSGSADAAIATDIATITAAFFTVEWYWDGIDRVYYGVDGTPLGFLDASTLPVGELTPAFGVQAGSAAARQGDFDYIFAGKERG